jgi:hypothetical protein
MNAHETNIVAAAQETPVFLDRKATLEKACDTIAEAGQNGAKLVVFPEAFIPAYPDWVWLVPVGKGEMLNELYTALVENAVAIPDQEVDVIYKSSGHNGQLQQVFAPQRLPWHTQDCHRRIFEPSRLSKSVFQHMANRLIVSDIGCEPLKISLRKRGKDMILE